MTQRVRDGLGLPAGFYRLNSSDPTVFVPNGITADHVESLVYANVVPVSGDRYDMVAFDAESNLFVPAGNPKTSPTGFNFDVNSFMDNVLHAIFDAAHPEGEFPYYLVPSESRANIVDDLATLQADFVLNP